jgi:hypothetical protein
LRTISHLERRETPFGAVNCLVGLEKDESGWPGGDFLAWMTPRWTRGHHYFHQTLSGVRLILRLTEGKKLEELSPEAVNHMFEGIAWKKEIALSSAKKAWAFLSDYYSSRLGLALAAPSRRVHAPEEAAAIPRSIAEDMAMVMEEVSRWPIVETGGATVGQAIESMRWANWFDPWGRIEWNNEFDSKTGKRFNVRPALRRIFTWAYPGQDCPQPEHPAVPAARRSTQGMPLHSQRGLLSRLGLSLALLHSGYFFLEGPRSTLSGRHLTRRENKELGRSVVIRALRPPAPLPPETWEKSSQGPLGSTPPYTGYPTCPFPEPVFPVIVPPVEPPRVEPTPTPPREIQPQNLYLSDEEIIRRRRELDAAIDRGELPKSPRGPPPGPIQIPADVLATRLAWEREHPDQVRGR